jgi:acetyl-CoA carboxylase biotin carboxyl carrier protein
MVRLRKSAGTSTHTTNHSSKKGHTLDIKLIKQVVDLMKRSDLSEFEFEEDGFKLRLSSKGADAPQVIHAAPATQTTAPFPVAAPATGEAVATPVEEKGISIIKSPMVGTFYSAVSPESPAFVKVGAKVSIDSVVCIIEAMKVMNEIQAEMSGTITELLVENGEAVEYGQPLFKVKTA